MWEKAAVGSGMGVCSLMGKVVCSSLKFTQALPLNKLSSHRIALALSNIRMSEMENNLFSGLEQSWKTSAAPRDHVSICGAPRGHVYDLC